VEILGALFQTRKDFGEAYRQERSHHSRQLSSAIKSQETPSTARDC
jgi:hypothetical protein